MDTTVTKEEGEYTVAIEGRVDTTTSPELDETLSALTEEPGIQLVLDCSDMDYISSAGLRVLLKAQKAVSANGGNMVIKNPSASVNSVFSITGFSNFLTIE